MQPDAKWGIGVSVRVGGEGWGKADESARTGIFLTLTMSTTIPALAWIPWMILRRQV